MYTAQEIQHMIEEINQLLIIATLDAPTIQRHGLMCAALEGMRLNMLRHHGVFYWITVKFSTLPADNVLRANVTTLEELKDTLTQLEKEL